MKNLIIYIFLLFVALPTTHAQKVVYEYDAAGNHIIRKGNLL